MGIGSNIVRPFTVNTDLHVPISRSLSHTLYSRWINTETTHCVVRRTPTIHLWSREPDAILISSQTWKSPFCSCYTASFTCQLAAGAELRTHLYAPLLLVCEHVIDWSSFFGPKHRFAAVIRNEYRIRDF